MKVRLFKLDSHPKQIAISKSELFVIDGSFFLDFSRPLKRLRWFGVLNRWFGHTASLLVPVIHQGQGNSELIIGIHRNDPHFSYVLALWETHYPSTVVPPTTMADGIKIVTDFAAQLPDNC